MLPDGFTCLDPDGFHIRLLPRAADAAHSHPFVLAESAHRIKDPTPSLHFYCGLLGMSLLCQHHGADESVYHVAQLPPGTALPADPNSAEALAFKARLFDQTLVLRHVHGTESLPAGPCYHNGNDQDKGQARGYGHTGFLVEHLQTGYDHLIAAGVKGLWTPEECGGSLAFVFDPDGYWVELIQRR